MKLNTDWRAHVQLKMGTDLGEVLRSVFIPPVNIIEQYATTRVTDVRAFMKLLGRYGHHIGAAGLAARQKIYH